MKILTPVSSPTFFTGVVKAIVAADALCLSINLQILVFNRRMLRLEDEINFLVSLMLNSKSFVRISPRKR